MLRPVTVGIDGSPESLAAADWAAREALRRRLPLRLVHSWNARPQIGPSVQDEETREHWSGRLLRETAAALRECYPELAVDSVEETEGAAATVLLAQSEESELLVLGSHGYGAVAGFMLGSLGSQLLARAAGPVVMVRTDGGRPADGAGNEVVVGVKGYQDPAPALLDFAFTAAAVRGAALRAVRAWSLPPVYGYGAVGLDPVDGQEESERAALTEALTPWREKYPQVEVVEQVESGARGEVLVRAAAGAGLLVVGRRVRRPALTMRVGPVAHAALHFAHCPVAVVPHD
ncbi:universal stress protein [Peterkaempfera bronchialis]|uniref:Universal stress protein n=1 Tax=Peterkaempfera bronchialis TaxID=2126346 RepID=A0A345SS53_9ACTN|nr:universal stress protein [Peterkaempfera bronchialis]AXI76558.1 universal stress protein [Peterkaempfera bronchialis]